jgi:high-affinity nickel permease
VLYLTLVTGVILSNYVRDPANYNPDNLRITLPSVFVALFIGLIAAPPVFGALKMTPDASFWAQLSLFAQQGVFWQFFITEIANRAFTRH